MIQDPPLHGGERSTPANPEIARYAIGLVSGSPIRAERVARKIKWAVASVIGSLALTVVTVGFIRLGPDLGEGAPFLGLILIAFAAAFVYSLVTLAVLVVSALTLQHVRIVQAQSDLCEVAQESEVMREILSELYRRNPKDVESIAARRGARDGHDLLAELGVTG